MKETYVFINFIFSYYLVLPMHINIVFVDDLIMLVITKKIYAKLGFLHIFCV